MFVDCSKLENVIIPATVTSIGTDAFEYPFYDTDGVLLTSASDIAGHGYTLKGVEEGTSGYVITSTPTPKPPSDGGNTTVIIVVAVIAVALIGVLAYFFVVRKGAKKA